MIWISKTDFRARQFRVSVLEAINTTLPGPSDMGISSGGRIQHQWAIPSGGEIENQNGSHKYHLWYDKLGINQSHEHVCVNYTFPQTCGPIHIQLLVHAINIRMSFSRPGSYVQRHNNVCMHVSPTTWGPFYKHRLTLLPSWISNHMPIKNLGWNYLSIAKLQRLCRWSLAMDKQCYPILYKGCNYLSMW